MVVWVKEYQDLTKKMLNIWLKKNIKLELFNGIEYVNSRDIIVVSCRDESIDEDLHNQYNVIVYEETIDIISRQITNYINENFDYFYMKNAISQGKKNSTNTIVTGSSYGRLGVNEKNIPNAVNISLSSQDIYYSLKGINKICESNDNIKNIVVCCGYYYFFSDMSKTKDMSVLQNIIKVYVPLYGNEAYHNCNMLARKMGG